MRHSLEEVLPYTDFIVQKLVKKPSGVRPTFKYIKITGETLEQIRLACSGRKTLRHGSEIETEKYIFRVTEMKYSPSLKDLSEFGVQHPRYTCYVFAKKKSE